MMKVSDPILFGHMVRQFYKPVFDKHQELFSQLGVNPNNGLGDLYEKIKGNPAQAEIEQDIKDCYAARPGLAMVDSSKGAARRSQLERIFPELMMSRDHQPPRPQRCHH